MYNLIKEINLKKIENNLYAMYIDGLHLCDYGSFLYYREVDIKIKALKLADDFGYITDSDTKITIQ